VVKQTLHQELISNLRNPDILNPDILNPDILNPDILNPDILNASFYLAPGETAKVALRVIDLDKNDNINITVGGNPPTPGVYPIESVQVGGSDVNAAVVAEAVNTEDAARGITSPRVATARLTVVTQELPSGRVGEPYSATLMADGGNTPYNWSIIAGTLAGSGLTLNSNGDITGTPLLSGTFSFSVQVTDAAARFDRRDFAIAVNPALGTATLAVVSQPNPCFDVFVSRRACS
jgi:hypothetical protein